MAVTKAVLEVTAGADFDAVLTITSGGLPVTLTGYSGLMQVRVNHLSPVLLELTDVNGGLIINTSLGTIDIVMSHVQTDAFTVQQAVFDLRLQDPSGKRKRVLQGTVKINPSVSR